MFLADAYRPSHEGEKMLMDNFPDPYLKGISTEHSVQYHPDRAICPTTQATVLDRRYFCSGCTILDWTTVLDLQAEPLCRLSSVSLVHSAFILTDDDKKILISAIVQIQDCLSLIVANIPVIITTTIDIVGEPDQVRWQVGSAHQRILVQRRTHDRSNGAAHNREDPAKLSCAKNTAVSAWNQNDLSISTAPVEPHTCTNRMGSLCSSYVTCCRVHNTRVTPIL
ncbi:hypothetical protein B0H13DRAFT_1935385 [Mycena leptocephala]|nr:hypothetical protein B0H13DRAFT_1935385 [Mycena leptocephala]